MSSEKKVCVNCNKELVETKIHWNNFRMYVERTPIKLFTSKETELVPYVCTSCGKTEWYAKEPSKLE